MRRLRRNEFLARPATFRGGMTMGVSEYPGFHTAGSEETTYAYAQQKAVPRAVADMLMPGQAPAEVRLDDYPVVVTLDMAGFKQHVDYDAVHFVQPRLWDLANEIIRQARADGTEPLATLAEYVEFGEESREWTPEDAVSYLYEYGSKVTEEPSSALLEFAEEQPYPNEFLRRLAARKLPDEALADITGQYRYLDDVPSERILSVGYLKPWWPDVLDWEIDEDDAALSEALEAAGWNVIGMEMVLSSDLYVEGNVVYRRQIPDSARVEYHGTTYHNVRSAAPELELPEPPLPFTPD